MESTKQTIEILQDLIQSNNERINGYEHAIKELNHGDEDLKIIFAAMIAESHHAKLDLAEEVQVMGKDVKEDPASGGKIYRAWIDIKSLFTGHGRHAVLDNCHSGEDAVQKAYTSALSHEHLPTYLRDLIQTQMHTFKASHDEVKALSEQEA